MLVLFFCSYYALLLFSCYFSKRHIVHQAGGDGAPRTRTGKERKQTMTQRKHPLLLAAAVLRLAFAASSPGGAP